MSSAGLTVCWAVLEKLDPCSEKTSTRPTVMLVR